MGMLIADSGSTKTHWVYLEGGKRAEYFSKGMNPYATNLQELNEILKVVRREFTDRLKFNQIFFYGAGCSEPDKVEMIRKAFERVELKAEEIFISHDLLAAARALFGSGNGIACILGTGSSSARYEDGHIAEKVMSLGYLIGDEGAGMDLGRNLLISILKNKAPVEILKAFRDKYPMSHQEILDEIYFKPQANRFIASFAPFLKDHLHHPFCKNLVHYSFRQFIELNVKQYRDYENLPVGFVGSVAVSFKSELKEVLMEQQLKPGKVIQSPMEGLITFHQN